MTAMMPESGGDTDAQPVASGAAALSRLRGRSGSEAVVSNPQLQTFFECWLDTFIFHGNVDPRLRELAILRVMWRCNQSYEWANHYRMARNVGLSREDILAIRTRAPERDLDGDVVVVVRAADDIVDRGHLTPDTYEAVSELFAGPGVLDEFLYLVAGYRMFASVSATTHHTAEASGLRMWPPDGVGPEGATA
jgi:Carboxymuconolactone decarboxylase family